MICSHCQPTCSPNVVLTLLLYSQSWMEPLLGYPSLKSVVLDSFLFHSAHLISPVRADSLIFPVCIPQHLVRDEIAHLDDFWGFLTGHCVSILPPYSISVRHLWIFLNHKTIPLSLLSLSLKTVPSPLMCFTWLTVFSLQRLKVIFLLALLTYKRKSISQ